MSRRAVCCSAGVGRSGTFIVLDRLIQHVEEHDWLDVYSTVAQMRLFRMFMVQTEVRDTGASSFWIAWFNNWIVWRAYMYTTSNYK